jgi:hypothetical protein
MKRVSIRGRTLQGRDKKRLKDGSRAADSQESNQMADIIEDARPAFVRRAERILNGITDGTLLTLKAHLLLEEALFEVVSAKCAQPQFFETANLSFHQQMQMARALCGVPRDDEKRSGQLDMFWEATKALNTLRNRLAHNLEPKALGPILKQLYVRELKDDETLSEPDVLNQLSITVSILIGFAWGLASTAKEVTGADADRGGDT